MSQHTVLFDMKDVRLGAPYIEGDIPSPPPHRIIAWVGRAFAIGMLPSGQVGRAGIELVFDLRTDPTQELLEYEVGEPRPIDMATRCDGGACRLPAHDERTVYRTFTGRNLCYWGYVAFLGERH